MFNKRPEENTSIKIKEVEHGYQLQIAELKKDNELAIKEKEFELKHFKDEEIQKLQKEVSVKEQKIAVLEKENEMLGKITNLNADIIDIKDLVNKLIEKLPTLNLSNLTIHNGTDK
jgi:hypothetical protein